MKVDGGGVLLVPPWYHHFFKISYIAGNGDGFTVNTNQTLEELKYKSIFSLSESIVTP